jgi:putative FmdB family regulatory protein
MPVYDFKCSECGLLAEIVASIDETPVVTCPDCDLLMGKVFSAPVVTFKGEGWGKDA